MKCDDATNELIAYAGGRTDSARRRELEKHAAGCGECRTRMEQFSALSSVLDELPAVEPSFGFDARVRQRVAAEPQRGWLGSWFHSFVPQPRLAMSCGPGAGSGTTAEPFACTVAPPRSSSIMKAKCPVTSSRC